MMKHSSRQSEKFSRIGACIRRNFTPWNEKSYLTFRFQYQYAYSSNYYLYIS